VAHLRGRRVRNPRVGGLVQQSPASGTHRLHPAGRSPRSATSPCSTTQPTSQAWRRSPDSQGVGQVAHSFAAPTSAKCRPSPPLASIQTEGEIRTPHQNRKTRKSRPDRNHAKACRSRKCPPKGKSHLDAKNPLINTDTLGLPPKTKRVKPANERPPSERRVALFWLGSKWTMALFGNRGLGPYSRMTGFLLFPFRPFRGNRLSATMGFRFQWWRNRFACRNVLLWRFSGRPNWRSR
jgi:hypothetical protein